MTIQELIDELTDMKKLFGGDTEVTLARGLSDDLTDPNNNAEITAVDVVGLGDDLEDGQFGKLWITIY